MDKDKNAADRGLVEKDRAYVRQELDPALPHVAGTPALEVMALEEVAAGARELAVRVSGWVAALAPLDHPSTAGAVREGQALEGYAKVLEERLRRAATPLPRAPVVYPPSAAQAVSDRADRGHSEAEDPKPSPLVSGPGHR